jgi:hypothetical protein
MPGLACLSSTARRGVESQRSRAQEIAERGRRLLKAGDARNGARELARAYALLADPKVLRQLADAYVEARRAGEGLALYQRLLREQSGDPDAREWGRRSRQLREQVGRGFSEERLYREHIDAGARSRRDAKPAEAIDAYSMAYAVALPEERALVLYNIARAHLALDEREQAFAFYLRASEDGIREEDRRLAQVGMRDLCCAIHEDEQRKIAIARQRQAERLAQEEGRKRRRLLWGVVGGTLAATALGVGLGVGLSQRGPAYDLGPYTLVFSLAF